ncbi:MAG: phosphotyrosine protein phosphatase [Gammaproteobacteria bacterium RBG_16_57_12]|nr:MAG: phosphotyrosine protein phosphatase [Gammaproteobacteria bacterium RBG_16_57_12]
MSDNKVKVLFVCMGNICRSPTAHGVFRNLVMQQGVSELILIDSAGTHAYHIGEAPDPRAMSSARRRGVDISDLRARRVAEDDFEHFDYILAMDRDNLEILANKSPGEHGHKIRLFLDYAPHMNEAEVPDPYYGGMNGFEQVLDLVEAAAEGLLKEIRNKHL